MALVRLDRPVAGVVPVPLAPALPAEGTRAVSLGYDRDAPDVVMADHSCAVVLRSDPVIGLSCPAVPGYSGGPILVRDGAGWRLAAIMVARGMGADRVGTYAVSVPDDLRTLIAGELPARRRIAPGPGAQPTP